MRCTCEWVTVVGAEPRHTRRIDGAPCQVHHPGTYSLVDAAKQLLSVVAAVPGCPTSVIRAADALRAQICEIEER